MMRNIKARSRGRLELLQWANEVLETDYTKVRRPEPSARPSRPLALLHTAHSHRWSTWRTEPRSASWPTAAFPARCDAGIQPPLAAPPVHGRPSVQGRKMGYMAPCDWLTLPFGAQVPLHKAIFGAAAEEERMHNLALLQRVLDANGVAMVGHRWPAPRARA